MPTWLFCLELVLISCVELMLPCWESQGRRWDIRKWVLLCCGLFVSFLPYSSDTPPLLGKSSREFSVNASAVSLPAWQTRMAQWNFKLLYRCQTWSNHDNTPRWQKKTILPCGYEAFWIRCKSLAYVINASRHSSTWLLPMVWPVTRKPVHLS